MHLSIMTPEGIFFEGETSSVIVPAENGQMGILNNHAPLISSLTHGSITYEKKGRKHRISINSGLVEVNHNKVIILTDHIDRKV